MAPPLKIRSVGYSNRTRYWQVYAFSRPPQGYTFKRAVDIPFHWIKTDNQFLLNTKWVMPFQGHDLYHVYNGIVPGRTPWISEVETRLPRYGGREMDTAAYRWGIKRLQSKRCRAIIYTSRCTQLLNRGNMENWGICPDKQHLVYRAVHSPGSALSGHESEFRIVFVGQTFFGKGGLELLKALERLNDDHIRVTIVSSFEAERVAPPSSVDREYVQRRFSEDKRITHLKHLSHEQVIALMMQSHLFVSTTYADTFNNSILEAMGCGLPIITSNVRAIPEFVASGENGFTTDIALADRETTVDYIETNIRMYLANEALRASHARRSLEIARERFSIERRNEQLKQIYDNALQG